MEMAGILTFILHFLPPLRCRKCKKCKFFPVNDNYMRAEVSCQKKYPMPNCQALMWALSIFTDWGYPLLIQRSAVLPQLQ